MERLDGENVSNVLTVFVSLSQAPSAKVRAKHIKVALNSSIYLTNTHIQLYLSRRAEGTCSEPTGFHIIGVSKNRKHFRIRENGIPRKILLFASIWFRLIDRNFKFFSHSA